MENPVEEPWTDVIKNIGRAEACNTNPTKTNGNGTSHMRDIIIVECQKLNGDDFKGTVNYSEAKAKIFQAGLGLNPSLLDTVKMRMASGG